VRSGRTILDSRPLAGHGALTGTFTEVSCSQWSGSDGGVQFNGGCLSGESAANWPSGTGCGNKGESEAFLGKEAVLTSNVRHGPIVVGLASCASPHLGLHDMD
jgi:hypothetical protein